MLTLPITLLVANLRGLKVGFSTDKRPLRSADHKVPVLGRGVQITCVEVTYRSSSGRGSHSGDDSKFAWS